MSLGTLLFSFSGRINRGKFWLGYILVTVLSLIAIVVIGALVPWDQIIAVGPDGQPVLDEAGNPQINFAHPGLVVPAALWGALALVSMFMAFAIMVKRCHDRGKSGWWSLISFIPIAGFVWLIIDLGVMEGDAGPNAYGPNPLGPQMVNV